MRWTIEQLKSVRESEDKVEFKRGEGGNIAYDGGSRTKPAERRRCKKGMANKRPRNRWERGRKSLSRPL